MLKALTKKFSYAAGVALVSTAAHAAKVDSASLEFAIPAGEIVAIAEDGGTYSKLQSASPLNVQGKLVVKMKRGRVHRYGIALGNCGGFFCGGPAFPMLDDGSTSKTLGVKNLERHVSFHLSANQFPLGLTNNGEGARILSTCNRYMGKSYLQKDKTYVHAVKVTLGLELSDLSTKFEVQGGVPTDHRSTHLLKINVRCKAPKPINPQIGYDHGDMKVKKVDLFLTTFQGVNHNASAGTSCPVLQLKARFETNQKGTVRFDLFKKFNDDPSSNTALTATARHKNGRFVAEYVKNYEFNKNTYAQFRVMEKENDIELSSPFKDIQIRCKSGASGGLTTAPATAPQTATPQQAAIQHPIRTADPAKGTCDGGRTIGKTCKCTGKTRLVRVSARKYRCEAKVPVAATAAASIRDVSANGTSKTVKCVNGRLSKNGSKCTCAKRFKRTRLSKNAYQCVKAGATKQNSSTSTTRKRRNKAKRG